MSRPSHDERDPELRLDVVYSSRSRGRAQAAFDRLEARGFTVRVAHHESRSRSGRQLRTHQVLVPSGQVPAATKAIASAPVVADEPPRPGPGGLRGRLGDRAYDGLTTVAWLAVAFAVLSIILLRAT